MTTTEDIAQDLQPNAAGTPLPPAPPPAPARRRSRLGHRPKIRAALDALGADNLLPPLLRPIARVRVVQNWLMRAGYAKDMPGRDAIEREYQRWLRERSAQNAPSAPSEPHATLAT
jgi:hypothetical protein